MGVRQRPATYLCCARLPAGGAWGARRWGRLFEAIAVGAQLLRRVLQAAQIAADGGLGPKRAHVIPHARMHAHKHAVAHALTRASACMHACAHVMRGHTPNTKMLCFVRGVPSPVGLANESLPAPCDRPTICVGFRRGFTRWDRMAMPNSSSVHSELEAPMRRPPIPGVAPSLREATARAQCACSLAPPLTNLGRGLWGRQSAYPNSPDCTTPASPKSPKSRRYTAGHRSALHILGIVCK